jgi:hypothetical protein
MCWCSLIILLDRNIILLKGVFLFEAIFGISSKGGTTLSLNETSSIKLQISSIH